MKYGAAYETPPSSTGIDDLIGQLSHRQIGGAQLTNPCE